MNTNGEGVAAIIQVAKQAVDMEKPHVVSGEGYARLAVPTAGREWTFQELPHQELRAKTLTVHTLTGLVDYVSSNRDQLALGDLLIHIVNHEKVNLVSRVGGAFHQRTYHVEAVFQPLMAVGNPRFTFGEWTNPEDFNIALQALFAEDEDRKRVLELVGNLKAEGVTEFSDDGVTQGVTARAGVALGRQVPVPNPIVLRPYRTFREVEQPTSKFVLRLKGGANEMPKVALFEADGGTWKLTAIERIRGYLLGKVQNVAIIG